MAQEQLLLDLFPSPQKLCRDDVLEEIYWGPEGLHIKAIKGFPLKPWVLANHIHGRFINRGEMWGYLDTWRVQTTRILQKYTASLAGSALEYEITRLRALVGLLLLADRDFRTRPDFNALSLQAEAWIHDWLWIIFKETEKPDSIYFDQIRLTARRQEDPTSIPDDVAVAELQESLFFTHDNTKPILHPFFCTRLFWVKRSYYWMMHRYARPEAKILRQAFKTIDRQEAMADSNVQRLRYTLGGHYWLLPRFLGAIILAGFFYSVTNEGWDLLGQWTQGLLFYSGHLGVLFFSIISFCPSLIYLHSEVRKFRRRPLKIAFFLTLHAYMMSLVASAFFHVVIYRYFKDEPFQCSLIFKWAWLGVPVSSMPLLAAIILFLAIILQLLWEESSVTDRV